MASPTGTSDTTRTKRRRMSSDARRDQLLDTTAAIVIDGGFHRLSIETVAQRAGITRGLVYQHFDDLDELLDTLVKREMARALTQMEETELANLGGGDPRELMLASLSSYLHVVQANPTTWRFVLMPPEGAPERLRTTIAKGRRAAMGRLAEAVRPVLRSESDEPDAEVTASVLSSMSDAYARLVLEDEDRFPPEKLLEHARWCLYLAGPPSD